MTDYCEKIFPTTMMLESFRKLALKTCKMPHWVELEGRDRAQTPNMLFISVVFCNIEERDRFVIALRFAEEERGALAKQPAASPRRAAAADAYAVA